MSRGGRLKMSPKPYPREQTPPYPPRRGPAGARAPPAPVTPEADSCGQGSSQPERTCYC
nr:MAG TPA: hypothetical protein [Caudoviricetes sp.]